MTAYSSKQLSILSQQCRIKVLEVLHEKGTGHWGGASSAAEILTVLYFDRMNIDPTWPDKPDRDRFILSKGHASAMLYAVLEERGFFTAGENLAQFRDLNSPLQGHPCMFKTPGVDMSTGALGHGLSVGLGMSLAAEKAERPFMVYVLTGEGCLDEGQTWEAVMAAAKFASRNLVLLIDYNKVQLDGPSGTIMNLEPLEDKFRAFNWTVPDTRFDGHSVDQIRESFRWLDKQEKGPCVIIYDTVKGRGVDFMENTSAWHGAPVKDEHFDKALPQLKKTLVELEKE